MVLGLWLLGGFCWRLVCLSCWAVLLPVYCLDFRLVLVLFRCISGGFGWIYFVFGWVCSSFFIYCYSVVGLDLAIPVVPVLGLVFCGFGVVVMAENPKN